MQSIGGQLRAARESRGLSIPDIEHELRISQGLLRDLEDDEYANFANLTYGRFFLSRYSDFLRVDTREFQKEFTVPELGNINDYPYLQEPEEVLRGVGGPRQETKQRPIKKSSPTRSIEHTAGQIRSLPLLVASGLGLLAMGLLLLFMRDKADEEFTEQIPETKDPSEQVLSQDPPEVEDSADSEKTTAVESASAPVQNEDQPPSLVNEAPPEIPRPVARAYIPPSNEQSSLVNAGNTTQPLSSDPVVGSITDTRPQGTIVPSTSLGTTRPREETESQIPRGAEPVAVPVPRAIPLN